MGRINPLSVAMGQAVRGAIAEAELTQAETATRADMALNTFSRRINGVLPFTWPELVRIADATNRGVSDLVSAAQRILNREPA